MSILIVGFDSAWTARNSGAVVGVLREDDGIYRNLGRRREQISIEQRWSLRSGNGSMNRSAQFNS